MSAARPRTVEALIERASAPVRAGSDGGYIVVMASDDLLSALLRGAGKDLGRKALEALVDQAQRTAEERDALRVEVDRLRQGESGDARSDGQGRAGGLASVLSDALFGAPETDAQRRERHEREQRERAEAQVRADAQRRRDEIEREAARLEAERRAARVEAELAELKAQQGAGTQEPRQAGPGSYQPIDMAKDGEAEGGAYRPLEPSAAAPDADVSTDADRTAQLRERAQREADRVGAEADDAMDAVQRAADEAHNLVDRKPPAGAVPAPTEREALAWALAIGAGEQVTDKLREATQVVGVAALMGDTLHGEQAAAMIEAIDRLRADADLYARFTRLHEL